MALIRRVATSYKHEQVEASNVWNIVHGLGGYPIVDSYTIEGGEILKIIPLSVTFIDNNTCTLTFTTPRSGFATVV